IDLQYGQIGALIGAEQLGVEFLAVVHDDGEARAVSNDVIVGDEVAILGDEEAGTLRDRTRLVGITAAATMHAVLAVAAALEVAEEALERMAFGEIVKALLVLEL